MVCTCVGLMSHSFVFAVYCLPIQQKIKNKGSVVQTPYHIILFQLAHKGGGI